MAIRGRKPKTALAPAAEPALSPQPVPFLNVFPPTVVNTTDRFNSKGGYASVCSPVTQNAAAQTPVVNEEWMDELVDFFAKETDEKLSRDPAQEPDLDADLRATLLKAIAAMDVPTAEANPKKRRRQSIDTDIPPQKRHQTVAPQASVNTKTATLVRNKHLDAVFQPSPNMNKLTPISDKYPGTAQANLNAMFSDGQAAWDAAIDTFGLNHDREFSSKSNEAGKIPFQYRMGFASQYPENPYWAPNEVHGSNSADPYRQVTIGHNNTQQVFVNCQMVFGPQYAENVMSGAQQLHAPQQAIYGGTHVPGPHPPTSAGGHHQPPASHHEANQFGANVAHAQQQWALRQQLMAMGRNPQQNAPQPDGNAPGGYAQGPFAPQRRGTAPSGFSQGPANPQCGGTAHGVHKQFSATPIFGECAPDVYNHIRFAPQKRGSTAASGPNQGLNQVPFSQQPFTPVSVPAYSSPLRQAPKYSTPLPSIPAHSSPLTDRTYQRLLAPLEISSSPSFTTIETVRNSKGEVMGQYRVSF